MIERRPALIAGVALFLMAVLAPIISFVLVPGLAANPAPSAWGVVVAGFWVVACLDLVVSWSLYEALQNIDRSLAGLAALFRATYAALFLAATNALVAPVPSLATFQASWASSLAVFGIHLIIVGAILIRSRLKILVLGLLVMLAGLGYTVDALSRWLSISYGFSLGSFTFVGELVLMVWLIVRGLRAPRNKEVVP